MRFWSVAPLAAAAFATVGASSGPALAEPAQSLAPDDLGKRLVDGVRRPPRAYTLPRGRQS